MAPRIFHPVKILHKYVLKEHVNRLRWAGAGLVICGVALVSL